MRSAVVVRRRLHPGAVGMTVSIVIPCFNHGRFLADAIDSACAQREVTTDVMVVDDGSTDNSRDVARRYPGVRTLVQPNGGVARARNAGFAATRGDVVIFLDADDRLLP